MGREAVEGEVGRGVTAEERVDGGVGGEEEEVDREVRGVAEEDGGQGYHRCHVAHAWSWVQNDGVLHCQSGKCLLLTGR